MSYVLEIPDKMEKNLDTQWQEDAISNSAVYEWVDWLKFLLAGVDCVIEFNEEWGYTDIVFAREEDKTWFILRWS